MDGEESDGVKVAACDEDADGQGVASLGSDPVKGRTVRASC